MLKDTLLVATVFVKSSLALLLAVEMVSVVITLDNVSVSKNLMESILQLVVYLLHHHQSPPHHQFPHLHHHQSLFLHQSHHQFLLQSHHQLLFQSQSTSQLVLMLLLLLTMEATTAHPVLKTNLVSNALGVHKTLPSNHQTELLLKETVNQLLNVVDLNSTPVLLLHLHQLVKTILEVLKSTVPLVSTTQLVSNALGVLTLLLLLTPMNPWSKVLADLTPNVLRMKDMTAKFLHHQFHLATTMELSALDTETVSTTLVSVNLNHRDRKSVV